MTTGGQTSAALALRARPVPAVDLSPPVAPTLPRREIPGARKVARNTVETLLFRGLSTPVALLLVVLQSRFLHADGRGAFVVAVLGVTIFSRLLGQLGVAVTNRLAHDHDVRGLMHRALALGLVLGSVATALVYVIGAFNDDLGSRVALLAALALVPNVLWQTVSGVLLGQARIRLWNYVQMLPPLLTLVGMLVLVVGLDHDLTGAVGAWTAANVATALIALIAARDTWLPLATPAAFDRTGRLLLRLALALGAIQVVNLISYRVELFILRRFESLGELGIYSIAMQAAEAIWLVAAALATAVTAPAVHESEPRAVRLIVRATRRALLLTAGVAAVVGVSAPFLVPLLFGEDFEGAGVPLALLLPGVVLYAPVTVLVVYLSVRRGRPRLSLAVSVVALVVTALASLALIPPFGTAGAAAASALGYVAGGALAWILFTRLAGVSVTGRLPAA